MSNPDQIRQALKRLAGKHGPDSVYANVVNDPNIAEQIKLIEPPKMPEKDIPRWLATQGLKSLHEDLPFIVLPLKPTKIDPSLDVASQLWDVVRGSFAESSEEELSE